MRPIRCSVLGLLFLFFGCAEEVTQDDEPDVPTSSATIAVFAPDSANPCNSTLPFPSDLALNPTTGLVNVPFCPEDDATTVAIKTGLRTLNGFSINGPIYETFSRPIAPASTAAAVNLIDTSTGMPVAFTTQFDPNSNRLFIVPSAPLQEETRYLVFITTGVTGVDGDPVMSDAIFTFAKSTTPLVNERGFSRYSALDDASANSLEALRQGFAPLFTQLEGLGVPRQNVAVAWTFTTQSVFSVMQDLWAGAQALGGATAVQQTTTAAATHPLVVAAGIPTDNLCDINTGVVTAQNFLTAQGTLGGSGTVNIDYMLVTPEQGGSCATPWSGAQVAVFAHALGRCKNDALAVADSLAALGYATLALDGPRAGGRSDSVADNDLDGCADQPAVPYFISTNPFVVRDGLRQWGIELAQAVSLARTSAKALAGDSSAAADTHVVMFGSSWGGMAAVLGGAVNATNVAALATNAASGELGKVFEPNIMATVTQGFVAANQNPADPAIAAQIAAETAETTATFRWILEPADPLYAAPVLLGAGVPALAQVVTANGFLANAPLHSTQTQTILATALNQDLAKVTFTLVANLGSGDEAICDDGTAQVAAILQPCATEAPNALAAGAALVSMRTQVGIFYAAGAVCTPDITTATCEVQ